MISGSLYTMCVESILDESNRNTKRKVGSPQSHSRIHHVLPPQTIIELKLLFIIITKKGAKQVFIRSPPNNKERVKNVILACCVQGYYQEVLTSIRFQRVKGVNIRDDIKNFEKSYFSPNYKFGVLYAQKGQSEGEMFSNGTYIDI